MRVLGFSYQWHLDKQGNCKPNRYMFLLPCVSFINVIDLYGLHIDKQLLVYTQHKLTIDPIDLLVIGTILMQFNFVPKINLRIWIAIIIKQLNLRLVCRDEYVSKYQSLLTCYRLLKKFSNVSINKCEM